MTEPSGLTLEMPLGKDLGFKVYWSSTTGKVIQPALSPCYKKKQKNKKTPFVIQVIILAGWIQRRLSNLDYLRTQNTLVGICWLGAQSCLTLCYPMDCGLPGSSVHRISQARVLEWVAISFSRESSLPSDQNCDSHTGRWILNHFPGGLDGKASAYDAGDLGSVPGLGRSPGEGNGNPLQYSCLENPMDQGVWWATVHGVAKSQTWLSDFTSLHKPPGKPLLVYEGTQFLQPSRKLRIYVSWDWR